MIPFSDESSNPNQNCVKTPLICNQTILVVKNVVQKFLGRKHFWLKNFWVKKFFRSTKFGVKKIFGSKKFWVIKIFEIKKCWIRNSFSFGKKTGRVNPRWRIYDPPFPK